MKTILALLAMTVSAFADLDAWNNSTNASIKVGAIQVAGTTNLPSWSAIVPSAKQDALSFTPVVLTPADSFTLTFGSPLVTSWLTLTGQVIIASGGLAAGNAAIVRVDNPTATNCNVILPSGWRKVSGTVTNILAPGAIGVLNARSFAANDTNVVSLWSSE